MAETNEPTEPKRSIDFRGSGAPHEPAKIITGSGEHDVSKAEEAERVTYTVSYRGDSLVAPKDLAETLKDRAKEQIQKQISDKQTKL